MTTLSHYRNILDAAGEPYHVLPLHEQATALITQRGGRVLGLFPTPDHPNLLWTSKAFGSVAGFHAFNARTDGWGWNLGGDRCWIAPEYAFNVRDRRDFGGTWRIPGQMDPGTYRLEASERAAALNADMTLTAYHHGAVVGTASLRIERKLYAVGDPVAALHSDHNVIYAGYEQQVSLQINGDDLPVPVEVWNLVQLNAGGTLIIPVFGAVDASDYVVPVPRFARTLRNGALHLPLDGRRQFKVGYKARCMTGRMGYLMPLGGGRAALLVRCFFNNPANPYVEEPPAQPGVNGHSVHVYNDNGAADTGQPFCEMECSGQTLGKFETFTRTAAVDTFSLWSYVGSQAEIDLIARALLGTSV